MNKKNIAGKVREEFIEFAESPNRQKEEERKGKKERRGEPNTQTHNMEQGAVIELVDSYPPPPPYYKLYTDENVELGSAPEPPAPVRGAYSMFGQLLTVRTIYSRT